MASLGERIANSRGFRLLNKSREDQGLEPITPRQLRKTSKAKAAESKLQRARLERKQSRLDRAARKKERQERRDLKKRSRLTASPADRPTAFKAASPEPLTSTAVVTIDPPTATFADATVPPDPLTISKDPADASENTQAFPDVPAASMDPPAASPVTSPAASPVPADLAIQSPETLPIHLCSRLLADRLGEEHFKYMKFFITNMLKQTRRKIVYARKSKNFECVTKIPDFLFSDFLLLLKNLLPLSLTRDPNFVWNALGKKDFVIELHSRKVWEEFFRSLGIERDLVGGILDGKKVATGHSVLFLGTDQCGKLKENFTVLFELGRGTMGVTGYITKFNRQDILIPEDFGVAKK
ncbi:MAG: hypothetical protein GY696_11870 [Gammaproteobacteria bacterium]|nr:hypothetical protein [Gammaproteobacteria bacterium]